MTGNVPPATGTFGGGQGRILFVAGGDRAKNVMQVDLATRQLTTLATIQGSVFRGLYGGVTRANDGSFVVVDYELTGPLSNILHYAADGSLLRSYPTGARLLNGAAISPDGRQVAFVDSVLVKVRDSYPFYEREYCLFMLDLASGQIAETVLIGHAEPPEDKISIRAQAVWSPDGTLHVLASAGLYRIDRNTLAATRLHQPDIGNPYAVVPSPDGGSLWFHQGRGNPYGGTIWSIDIASGALSPRSIRSRSGGQYSPCFSPDGNWLLMQETSLTYLGIAIASYYYICAIRRTAEPIDTQDLRTAILDGGGNGFTASDRMVWY